MSKYQYLKFEREARDCPHNDAGKRPTIYDFDVLVEREHRATFRKEIYGKGYRLYDADGRPIPARYDPPDHHLGMHVDKQDDFDWVIRDQLAAHRIPTLARLAELRAEEADWEVKAEAEARKRMRERKIEAHSLELYRAVKMLFFFEDAKIPEGAAAIENARQLIRKVEDIGENDEHFKERLDSEKWGLKRERWKPEPAKEAA